MKSLLKRTLSATAIVVLLVGGLLISPWIYAPLAIFAMISTIVEYYKLNVRGQRYVKEKACIYFLAIVAFVVTLLIHEFGISPKWLFATVFPILICQGFMLIDCRKDFDLNMHIFFPLMYLILPFTLSVILMYPRGEFDGILLLSIYIIAWLNDVGAYIFGMSFGQRPGSKKLAPEISPKKSWIGVVGGTITSFAAALGIWKFIGADYFPLIHWMAIAALISLFGVCGDLFESLIKRHSSVKDASNFIPGHGGMLDRFDDILFVIPAVVAYLKLFELI